MIVQTENMNRPLFVTYRIDQGDSSSFIIQDVKTRECMYKIENIPHSHMGRIIYFDGDHYLIYGISETFSYMYSGNIKNTNCRNLNYIPHVDDWHTIELGSTNIDTRIFPTKMLYDKMCPAIGRVRVLRKINKTQSLDNNTQFIITMSDEYEPVSIDPVLKLEEKVQQGIILSHQSIYLLRIGYYYIPSIDRRYIYDDLDGSLLCVVNNFPMGLNVLYVPESHPVFIRFQEKVHLHVKDFIQSRSLCNIVAGYV